MGKDRVEKGPGSGRAAKKFGWPATFCPQKFWDFPQNFIVNHSVKSYPDFGNVEGKF
jgi:hypothetical protein